MGGGRMPESMASRSFDQGGFYYRLTLSRKHSTSLIPTWKSFVSVLFNFFNLSPSIPFSEMRADLRG
jgi:hypothetical protein